MTVMPTTSSLAGLALVADDDEQVRQLTTHILAARGYAVIEAADGTDAVRLAAAFDGRIDLLVTDVVMPGMGGIEAASQIAGARPDVRILFMSAFLADDGLPPGAAFLPKPFTPDQLARAAGEAIGGGRC